ncbi:hypothetical protein [Deinococcus hopiensis]|uniref:Uncharacterized protein n=1 Tax=Deinococcus hopiensis KR-140 TaxID=695939 RepID=A0A1W1V748_9DEIO|nr:hypothetical protein [Deinococcus hopiensis]SMB89125.1 hypothetical protein SAMN00790413_00279 [Deinococcus hopiensis KR-140]
MKANAFSIKANVYTDGAHVKLAFERTFAFSRPMNQTEQEAVVARVALVTTRLREELAAEIARLLEGPQ